MNFLNSICISITLAAALSGCASNPFTQGGDKGDASKICIGSPKSCTPTVGNRIKFKDQYIPIAAYSRTGSLADDANPNLAAYLGTVVQNRNHRGEPGAICGKDKKNPFTPNDFTDAIVETAAKTSDNVEATRSSTASASFTETLKKFGIDQTIIDRAGASAEFKRITDSLDASDANAELVHREYRIKEKVLRAIETAEKGDHFYKCQQELTNGKWRMYQAISVIDVQSNSVAFVKNREPITTFAAKIAGSNPEINAAAFEAELKKVEKRTADVVAGPYYLVVGASFWHSPRLHKSGWFGRTSKTQN